ncbi:MAG: signal recognition particle protein [Thermoanaerobaculia bacterium]|nr:signal recognition particle protein [Thermoanaerobaculia bacterium]
MFESLQERFQGVFRQLRTQGRVREEHVQAAMREIRLALLEADVHFKVVRSFVERVREQALGADVLASLTPDQQVLKIVRDELVALLGEAGGELRTDVKATGSSAAGRTAVVLLCGLQGSGKTTTAGKLARRLRSSGRRPLLVAADLQRAAAVEQLRQVGQAIDIPVLTPEDGEDVATLGRRLLVAAPRDGHDVAVVDTAGRLHVDEGLMAELAGLVEIVNPTEILLVADAMTGQDAVRSAGDFAAAVDLTGVVLTKLDGDARGGAALSIRNVTGVPVRFVGVGEKAEDLEVFDAERMASRILGMGDVLSLIEKAEKVVDGEDAQRLARRMAKRQFTLEDLQDQLRQLRRMGPLSQLVEMLPRGGPFRGLDASQIDEARLVRIQAMIGSMTPQERRKPEILNASRKRRVARGSGTTVQDVNQLLKQHREMKRMMKKMKGKFLRGALGGGPF